MQPSVQDEIEENRRLASMRAGLISVGMLVGACFALSFILAGSELEANTGEEDNITVEAQP